MSTGDRVHAAFEQLRREGYRLDLHQLRAALALAEGWDKAAPDERPNEGPDRLVSLLTPVFATSPAEQTLIRRRLTALLGAGPIRIEPEAPPPPLPAVLRVRTWPVPVAVLVAAVLALGLVYVVNFPPLPLPPPRVQVPETIGEGDTAWPKQTQQVTFSSPTIVDDPYQPVLRWGLIGAPLVPLALWLGLRWHWWRHWRKWRRERAEQGYEIEDLLDFGHRTTGTALFASPDLAAVARQWRRFTRVPTRTLDAERTVTASAENAGLFSPVFAERPLTPSYVVLIEERGRHDHLARLADNAVDRLEAEGVMIDRYYYCDGLGALRDAKRLGAARSLPDLHAEAPHRGLVIIGSGSDLFQPLTDRLDPTTAAHLALWPNRTVLSLRPIEVWSEREQTLLDHGLALGTAGKSGLRALGDYIARGRPESGRLLEGIRLVDPPETAPEPEPPPDPFPPLTVFRDLDQPWCPEMVVIPPGEFLMGSPVSEKGRDSDEGPQHHVTISARFALGRYPVTFEEYDHFCAATGREKPDDQGWGRDRRPAINVSWQDAQAYVAWLSQETSAVYRLPSEAEWEYACRAGSTGRWSFGDDEALLADYAWYQVNSERKTHPVGEKRPNGFGFHDLHGNVWEWVEDVWHKDYQGAPADGSAWTTIDSNSTSVVRGGSWNLNTRYLRSAIRVNDTPDLRYFNVGFRVARTLTP